jgi:hypothetical protein
VAHPFLVVPPFMLAMILPAGYQCIYERARQGAPSLPLGQGWGRQGVPMPRGLNRYDVRVEAEQSLVDLGRFELPTPWLQTRCSPN